MPFVGECFGDLLAAFCGERIDECAGDQYGSFKRSAVCFNTARDIDRITDDRQFQVLVTTDITLHHIAIVDAYGNTNCRVTGSPASLVPSVDRLLDIQRAACCIGRVDRARNWRAKDAINPSPRNFSIVPL